MSTNEKKLNGVVYTPQWVVNLILDNLAYDRNIHEKKIIDPACGEGAFLSEIAERFITDAKQANLNKTQIKKNIENNVFGFDIDEIAIKKCIASLDKIALRHNLDDINWQIIRTDSIDKKNVSRYFNSFDFVVGNPPYVRIQHLGKERRYRIQNDWHLSQKGSTDIFITFFELGFYLLNKTGKLGYITPNTYLKTKAGENLRNFIKTSRALKVLIDFEHNQLFENATTYSVITILDKGHQSNDFALYKGDSENVIFIDNINLGNLNGDNWILTSNDMLQKLKEIEKRGVSLSRIAKIHVGITTLADDFYIFKDPEFKNSFAKIKLKDGRVFRIEKNILKPIVKASVLKDPDEEQNRYIIFPYQKINDKHVIIPENELKSKFPLTYKYFLAVKENLDKRDKGKPNQVAWYAFGRSQGLDTSFGKKILTSPINLKPNFLVWEKPGYTFFAGYCIKFDGNLKLLAKYLNSQDMEFYISHVSRCYQNNYKSFAKSFIKNFGIPDFNLSQTNGRRQLLLDVY